MRTPKAQKTGKPARGAATASGRTSRQTATGRTTRTRRPVRDPKRIPVDAPPRGRTSARDARPARSAPRTTPNPRLTDTPARPKSASQAKARAKARKAKAPKVVRPPLRQRLLSRLASIELNPRRLVARVPFVVLVIGCLGLGLGVTLWLSTDAAERSYQLGHARQVNQALMQQKEALERDVLAAQAAPALAEAARNLGMIPSRDTAHLVQDASGNWVVVGTPKPAEGVPPPPLNAPLPEPAPPAPPAPRVVTPSEVPVRLPSQTVPLNATGPVPTAPGLEVPHAVSGQLPTPGPVAALPPVAAPLAAAAPPAAPGDAGEPHLVPGAPAVPGAPSGTEQVVPAAPVPGPPA
ncbi:hypothetical protein MJO55_16425 [Mycolicibacterium rufum]|uniref:FHA domain-containing protein n=1 Tax=Mycolicibacterium rufum TaxID=318424 RepID=A0ABY3U8R1_9MYCO|nr:hypothetical protein [Mycolicibacterium rufum]KGI68758.1 membrane protein [Mycolicibacterium rufum]ULP34907.1 hypothetical protein MJO55_16425 [Mycolicibacterium rufum]